MPQNGAIYKSACVAPMFSVTPWLAGWYKAVLHSRRSATCRATVNSSDDTLQTIELSLDLRPQRECAQ